VRQYKQQVVEQMLAEKALQQQQTKQPTFDTEEEALAYQFAQKYIVPQIKEPLERMQQEQAANAAVNQALMYANQRATQDQGFAEALSSGALKHVVDEYGLPPSSRSIDMAYDIYRGRNAETQQEAFSEAKGRLADEKSRAALSTGGSRSSGSQSHNDLIERMREEIMNPDISPDKAMEIMKKKYKIDIGRQV
jgi:hypothetical protein